MPIDASIPLQAVAPDPMKSLSGMLNMATNAQALKKAQATFDADVAQRQAESSTAQSNATVNAANVNPLIQQQAAQTSSAQSKAGADQFALTNSYANASKQIASGLLADPAITDSQNYDPQKAVKAILAAKDQMIAQGVPKEHAELGAAHLLVQAQQPGAVAQALKNTVLGGMAPASQAGAISPTVSAISTDQGTQLYNSNPLSTTPQGNMGTPYAPPNQIVNTPTGRMGIANPASGNVSEPTATGPAPVNRPNGETAESEKFLQDQRMGAQQTALAAPQLHDINRTIIQEAQNLKNGGTLAQLTQKLSSATGFNLGNESATGYNLLGKMLERSALTAAQSQGPHTNAGLEAVKAANGTLDYTPDSLKTIARLNDALTTGAEKYHQGLEAAIGSSPNNVFAKRQFDQQWGQNADVNALKLLRASNAKDAEGIAEVVKAVGGPGSDGAKKLGQQLQNLKSLSTKGSL